MHILFLTKHSGEKKSTKKERVILVHCSDGVQSTKVGRVWRAEVVNNMTNWKLTKENPVTQPDFKYFPIYSVWAPASEMIWPTPEGDLTGGHSRQRNELLRSKKQNSVQTDFLNLDWDFRESDARQFTSNKFKHSITWKEVSWYDARANAQKG